MTKNITFKKICQYCNKPSDGPMLTMGETMAHADCVIRKLNELLDYDYNGKYKPLKFVGYINVLENVQSLKDEKERTLKEVGERLMNIILKAPFGRKVAAIEKATDTLKEGKMP